MIANKVYTCAEMREERIYTGDYRFLDKEGEYIATLIMRAEASSGIRYFKGSVAELVNVQVFYRSVKPGALLAFGQVFQSFFVGQGPQKTFLYQIFCRSCVSGHGSAPGNQLTKESGIQAFNHRFPSLRE